MRCWLELESTGHMCWSVTPYGGRIARVYAEAYPREVVGMVLVDPGTLGDDPRFPRQYHKELAAEERLIIVARWLAPFGVVRLFRPRTEYYDLPAQQAAASDSFAVTTRFWQTIIDQHRAIAQTRKNEGNKFGLYPADRRKRDCPR